MSGRVVPEPSGPIASSRPWVIESATALIALTCIAYLPALWAGFFWDDAAGITQNQTLRSIGGLWRIWSDPWASPQYYPLAFTSFWIEHQLWGLSPFGYHAVNVVLHGINATLLWILLRHLQVPGAFAAAAIFAAHPIHVDSVAWITERKNVLSGAFALLTLLAWWRFVHTRRGGDYLVGLVLFACALLSKTAVCTVPLVFLLIAWWREPETWRRQIFPAAGALLLAAGGVALTIWREHVHELLDAPVPALSLLERALVAGRAVWFYAGKLVWPMHLMTVYPHWRIDGSLARQYAFPAAALVGAALLWWYRQRIGRGPVVAVLTFWVLLVPALGFIPFDFQRLSYVADHFQYLASMPLIALLVGTAVWGLGRLRERCRVGAVREPPEEARRIDTAGWGDSRIAPTSALLLIVLLATLTWQRASLYADEATVWRHDLAQDPQSWLAHTNLGDILQKDGRFSEALPHFAAAVRLNPNFASGHNFLGLELLRNGDARAALEHFATAARLKPDFASAYNNWGLALKALGRPADAIEKYRIAIQLKPDNYSAYNNWGAALASQGKLAKAVERYELALALKPDAVDTHFNLGLTLLEQKRLDAAIEHFAAAVRLNPDLGVARFNLGETLLALGRADDAVPHLTVATRLMPTYAPAFRLLATALEQQGKPDQAAAYRAQAAQLDLRQ